MCITQHLWWDCTNQPGVITLGKWSVVLAFGLSLAIKTATNKRTEPTPWPDNWTDSTNIKPGLSQKLTEDHEAGTHHHTYITDVSNMLSNINRWRMTQNPNLWGFLPFYIVTRVTEILEIWSGHTNLPHVDQRLPVVCSCTNERKNKTPQESNKHCTKAAALCVIK